MRKNIIDLFDRKGVREVQVDSLPNIDLKINERLPEFVLHRKESSHEATKNLQNQILKEKNKEDSNIFFGKNNFVVRVSDSTREWVKNWLRSNKITPLVPEAVKNNVNYHSEVSAVPFIYVSNAVACNEVEGLEILNHIDYRIGLNIDALSKNILDSEQLKQQQEFPIHTTLNELGENVNKKQSKTIGSHTEEEKRQNAAQKIQRFVKRKQNLRSTKEEVDDVNVLNKVNQKIKQDDLEEKIKLKNKSIDKKEELIQSILDTKEDIKRLKKISEQVKSISTGAGKSSDLTIKKLDDIETKTIHKKDKAALFNILRRSNENKDPNKGGGRSV